MSRERKQKRSFISLVIPYAVLVVSIYLVFNLITAQVDIASKRRALENVENQVLQQKALNKELERAKSADNESAYIERIAREKLNLALPDERVFIDMSGK